VSAVAEEGEGPQLQLQKVVGKGTKEKEKKRFDLEGGEKVAEIGGKGGESQAG